MHFHDYEELQFIVSGSGELLLDGGPKKIRAGDVFVTVGSPPGYVYVHSCPHCASGDYITTHPDATPTNNLLHLPRF